MHQRFSKPEMQVGCWRLAGRSGVLQRSWEGTSGGSAVASGTPVDGSERLTGSSGTLGADVCCGPPAGPAVAGEFGRNLMGA